MPKRRSEVVGAKELNEVLKALPEQLQKNALASVARAGARQVQRAAYAQLAVAMESRTPREEDVIIKKRRTPKDRVAATYDVGPPTSQPELRWLHDGTDPHTITARRKQILANSETVFGRSVQHPGQPANPWLRKAYFLSKDLALKAMAVQMRKALKKQVNRLVSQKYRGQLLSRIRRKL